MSVPTWQVDPCPDWCTIEHQEHDHPDDRAHRDDGVAVAITIRVRTFEREIVEHVEPVEVILGRWKRDGEAHTWRFIGADTGLEIELTEESFQRVLDAMQQSAASSSGRSESRLISH